MAEKKLAEIEAEARRRWPVDQLAMTHRLGHLELGEVSVAVAVSCPHRQEAFEAARFVIDTLKATVPIWKKENWADGTNEWVHPGVVGPSPLAPLPVGEGNNKDGVAQPILPSPTGRGAGGEGQPRTEPPQKNTRESTDVNSSAHRPAVTTSLPQETRS
jgi:hypothetical protein